VRHFTGLDAWYYWVRSSKVCRADRGLNRPWPATPRWSRRMATCRSEARGASRRRWTTAPTSCAGRALPREAELPASLEAARSLARLRLIVTPSYTMSVSTANSRTSELTRPGELRLLRLVSHYSIGRRHNHQDRCSWFVRSRVNPSTVLAVAPISRRRGFNVGVITAVGPLPYIHTFPECDVVFDGRRCVEGLGVIPGASSLSLPSTISE
jgi:hypothetical protein